MRLHVSRYCGSEAAGGAVLFPSGGWVGIAGAPLVSAGRLRWQAARWGAAGGRRGLRLVAHVFGGKLAGGVLGLLRLPQRLGIGGAGVLVAPGRRCREARRWAAAGFLVGFPFCRRPVSARGFQDPWHLQIRPPTGLLRPTMGC